MKNDILKFMGVMAACVAMAACGNGGGDGDGDGSHGNGGDSSHNGDAGNGNGGGGAEAPAGDQSTPQGAVDLFIGEMREADFDGALAYVDPSCKLYEQLLGLTESDSTGADASALEIVKKSFLRPYIDVTSSISSVDGNRAEGVLHFTKPSIGDKPFEMTQLDGKWFILGGTELTPTDLGM